MTAVIDTPDRELFPFEVRVQEFLKPIVKDKVVLDIGGYDGRQAKFCLDNGAKKAICIDNCEYDLYNSWKKFKPYEGVIYQTADFYYYDRMADITIFQNVIYHQKNPWQAMEKVRSLTRDTMVMSTSFVEGNDPVWRVYSAKEADPNYLTVSWRPTISGLMTVLENVGFSRVELMSTYDVHLVAKCVV